MPLTVHMFYIEESHVKLDEEKNSLVATIAQITVLISVIRAARSLAMRAVSRVTPVRGCSWLAP